MRPPAYTTGSNSGLRRIIIDVEPKMAAPIVRFVTSQPGNLRMQLPSDEPASLTPTRPGKRRAKRSRVIALLNAISDLHEGDLSDVLELDRQTPLKEFGENDTSMKLPDGTVEHTPGFPPPPKSLKDRVRTGKQMGQILEAQLTWVMVFGEVIIPSIQKKPRAQREMGGRQF